MTSAQHTSDPRSPSTGRSRRRGGRGRGQGAAQAPVQPLVTAPVVPAGDAPTVLPTDTTFDALGVPAPLVEVLAASGITAPFRTQFAPLPHSWPGRDVRARGRTGSGRTLAFGLPLVARLAA